MNNRLKYNHRPSFAEESIVDRRLFRQNVCPIVLRHWHQFLLPSNQNSPNLLLFYHHRGPNLNNRLKYNHRLPFAEERIGHQCLFRQNVCPIVLRHWHQFLLPSNQQPPHYHPNCLLSYHH